MDDVQNHWLSSTFKHIGSTNTDSLHLLQGHQRIRGLTSKILAKYPTKTNVMGGANSKPNASTNVQSSTMESSTGFHMLSRLGPILHQIFVIVANCKVFCLLSVL